MDRKTIVFLIFIFTLPLIFGGFLFRANVLEGGSFLASLTGPKDVVVLSESDLISLKERIQFLEEELNAKEFDLEQLDNLAEENDLLTQRIIGLKDEVQILQEAILEYENNKNNQEYKEDERPEDELNEELEEELQLEEESGDDTDDTDDTNDTDNIKEKEGVCQPNEININTASFKDLQKITGVGPSYAQKIINLRMFCSLDDLLKVSGIGEKTLQKIKEQGCVYVTASACASSVSTYVPSGGGGGGGGGNASTPAKPVFPKILILEVQVLGEDDKKQEFVELYNPNNNDVSLTGWYLQKKTAGSSDWSTYASKNLFNGKTILANGYFLIARTDYYLGSADIFTDSAITDGNSFALKNPNGDISDKLGFGEARDPELLPALNPLAGQSLGRKFDSVSQTYLDTDDNSADFEIQQPTPRAQNIAWVEPQPAPKDTTPPEVVFMLEAIQNGLNFTIDFEITDPLDTVTPSGLASYIFRWQAEGEDWQEDLEQEIAGLPMSYNSGREFLGENGKTYFFQITARDLLVNDSGWMPETPATTTVSAPDSPVVNPAVSHIIINEVQISQIGQRFIELYNPNDVEINLTGWYLQRKKQNDDSWDSFVSSSNFEEKIMPANGYFLISRELENSDILLNIALKDNESLALKNSDWEIVDKVGWGEAQDFETAPAQNPLAGQSITRTGGVDTDNNSADFTPSNTPTPGSF